MIDLYSGASSTLARMFMALDGHDYETLAACFCDDGVWLRQGKSLEGPAAIQAELVRTKPATRTTIHVVSNVCVDEVSPTNGMVRFYLAVYRHESETAPPYPVPTPRALGLSRAKFHQTGARWCIQHLATGPFVFST